MSVLNELKDVLHGYTDNAQISSVADFNQLGTTDVISNTSAADDALALAQSIEQAILVAEHDAATVNSALSTVNLEAESMEAYRMRGEEFHTTAENAKLNALKAADGDAGSAQAKKYALIASAAATKSLELKQQTQSTEIVKSATSSAREAAEKVRLASVRAAEAKLTVRSVAKLVMSKAKEVTEDAVLRVDACAERIFHLHELTQQTLRIITQRCSQALAARTQGDTAVMRTVRAAKEATKKPSQPRSFTENLQSRSGESLLSSRSEDSQTGEDHLMVPEISTQEFGAIRSSERTRAARAAASTLRSQRNVGRAELTKPGDVTCGTEPIVEDVTVPAISTFGLEPRNSSVEAESSKTDHSVSTVTNEAADLYASEICVNQPVDDAGNDELRASPDLCLLCEDLQQAAVDVLQAECASCEAILSVISAKEVTMQVQSRQDAESQLSAQEEECAKESVEALTMLPEHQGELEALGQIPLSDAPGHAVFADAAALDLPPNLALRDDLVPAVLPVYESQLLPETFSDPVEPAMAVKAQVCAVVEIIVSIVAADTEITPAPIVAIIDSVLQAQDCSDNAPAEDCCVPAFHCVDISAKHIPVLEGSPETALEEAIFPEIDAQNEDIEVLLEVARLAEEEVEQWSVEAEKIALSVEDILMSAEEAAHTAEQAHILVEQELHTVMEYRSLAEDAYGAVRDALHCASKEAKLCEEDFKSLQLQIQTADDALMAEHASIEEELSQLSVPILHNDSEDALSVWTMERACVLQKIADKMERMLDVECRREELAKEHMKYVRDRPHASVAREKAASASEHSAAAGHKKNSFSSVECVANRSQAAREAIAQAGSATRRAVEAQAQLRDALESANMAVETFKEAATSLEAGMNCCDAADAVSPHFNRDAQKFLSRHTLRRVNATRRVSSSVEEVIALEGHVKQSAQKVTTACDQACTVKKEGDAFLMRCVISSAKASALATDARQTEAKMVASAKAAHMRAQEYVKNSRKSLEKSRTAAAEAEDARQATQTASESRHSNSCQHDDVGLHNQQAVLRRSSSDSRRSSFEGTRVPSLIIGQQYGSPQVSPRLSNVSSPPHSARMSSISSPPQSARLSDVYASPPLSSRKGSENRMITPQAALERVEGLRCIVRDAAARAEEWTLSAERVALSMQHTVQNAEFAADAAREATQIVQKECTNAKNSLAQAEQWNASAFDSFYAASVYMNACEETKRALVKRINIADGVLQDERASVDEEIYLLEETSTARGVGMQRTQLMSQLYAAVFRREQQALEHVAIARARTKTENAQKHADQAASFAAKVVVLQPNANNSDQCSRVLRSSAQAAAQVSIAAQEAAQCNHEVHVALEETRKASDAALQAAMDLRLWKAECERLDIDCSRGELQELNNMPWFTQRCSEAARQVQEMVNHIMMLQEMTQNAAAQATEQSQQIQNIRSETELTVSRVLDASREASEVATRVAQLELETFALAEAALVRSRNEASAIRSGLERKPSASALQFEAADRLIGTEEATHVADFQHLQTALSISPAEVQHAAVVNAQLRQWEESCQTFLNRVQLADEAFSSVRESIEKELARLNDLEHSAEVLWETDNTSQSLRSAQSASFAQQRSGLDTRLVAAASIREEKVNDILIQAREQQQELKVLLRENQTVVSPGAVAAAHAQKAPSVHSKYEVVMGSTDSEDSRESATVPLGLKTAVDADADAEVERVLKVEAMMFATVEVALTRAQDVSRALR